MADKTLNESLKRMVRFRLERRARLTAKVNCCQVCGRVRRPAQTSLLAFSTAVMITAVSVTANAFHYAFAHLALQNSTLCCFQNARLVPQISQHRAKKYTVE